MSSSSPSAGGESPDGARTYRGRTIEELIPRIRAELGPDAIILREREGLTGGIGGFFAQRCVEIDAQAAPRVNVYADDFDEDEEYEEFAGEEEDEGLEDGLETGGGGRTYDQDFSQATVPFPAVSALEPAARPEPPTLEPAAPLEPPALEPAAPPEPPALEPVVPEPIAQEPVAPAPPTAPFLDEASFAARLEEATFTTDAEPEPEPIAEQPPAPRRTPSFIAFDELEDPPAAPVPVPEPPAEPDWLAEPETPAEPEELDEPVRSAEPEWLDEPPAPAAPRDVAELEELDAVPAAEELSPEPEPEPQPQPEPEPEPAAEPARAFTPEPLAPAPWLAFAQEDAAAAQRSRPTPPRSPIQAAPPTQAAPAPPTQAAPAPQPTTPEPAPPAALAQPVPAPPAPAPAPPAISAPAPGTPAAPGPLPAPYGYGVRRRGGLLPAAERMLRAALDATTAANERRELEYQARLVAALQHPAAFPTGPPAPAAAQPLAPVAGGDEDAHLRQRAHRRDAELERRLVARGLSPSRAAVLVGAAISQRGPFSNGSALADDVRATIATSLPAPNLLPLHRGAVAIIGAGGSGKTRCVAALAVAHARAGAVVSVASFGTPGREDELGELLHGEAVNVIPAMRTRATARAVTSARERGLVIIDTAAVTPATARPSTSSPRRCTASTSTASTWRCRRRSARRRAPS